MEVISAGPPWAPRKFDHQMSVGDVVRIHGLSVQVQYNDHTAVIESLLSDGYLGLRVLGGKVLKISAEKVIAEDEAKTKQASTERLNTKCFNLCSKSYVISCKLWLSELDNLWQALLFYSAQKNNLDSLKVVSIRTYEFAPELIAWIQMYLKDSINFESRFGGRTSLIAAAAEVGIYFLRHVYWPISGTAL